MSVNTSKISNLLLKDSEAGSEQRSWFASMYNQCAVHYTIQLRVQRQSIALFNFMNPIKLAIAITATTICCMGNDVPAKAQYIEQIQCTMTNDRAMLAAMGCPTMVTPMGVPVREPVHCAMTNDRMMRAALRCPAQIYY